ncbi:MAG: hypothetical protein K6G23_08160 [Lachnospiraceae bacterium]|nr:hypothetical protein [Lachnospiraceae bacterium]
MISNTDPILQAYQTPYRYSSPVLTGSGKKGAFDEKAVDIPFVFWHRDRYYMLYTGYDGIGYQSALATSTDLLHWEHKAVILKRSDDHTRWDHVGGAATWIIKESDDLWSIPKLRKIDGKYWMVYHSYPSTGYENGPAQIGLAWCDDEELLTWHYPDEPVFSWKDGADWERGGLYKACIIEHNGRWYMFYNAKDQQERWIEQTGMAYSDDLKHWERCPQNPVLRVNPESWDERFVSDPYIVKDHDHFVDFYFGYGKVYPDGHAHAQEGLALSKDLIHWEKATDPVIPFGMPGENDCGHAHKASIVYDGKRLYHFYCGTRPWKAGDPTDAYGEFRTICVASDQPFEEDSHIRPFLWMKGEGIEEIDREIRAIRECGIKELCLESRPFPGFCKEPWWERVAFVLKRAKEEGMRVWILDDDKFPTGHANGAFERCPEKKKWYLAERHMDIYGPCRQGAVLIEPFYQGGELLGVLALPKPDGQTLAVSMDGAIDLTEKIANGFVYFDLPKGPYRLFVLYTTQNGGGREDYMNLIDASSVRVLIDEVYETHYAHFKDDFGTTFAGFFSDEPELGNVKGYPFDDTLGIRDQKLPWSSALEERLRGLWGTEFLQNLIALWYDAGAQTPLVRSTYMDRMTMLVKECFSGQIGAWCREHGVAYIGHIIEDDNAHTRMGCSIGHYFREMQGQHMAGIDVVHHQIVPGFTEPVHQWIAGDRDGEFFHFGLAKLAASAAHLQENKRGRALCEIFGNYGWAEGNSLMKWLTDHMLVRGINEFTPHAFSMVYPDRDCPPHFYVQGKHPGFACFTQLMRYMNHAARFLSGGIHVAEAAILYHAEAEWSGGECELFQTTARALMEHQMDFDLVTEDDLSACMADAPGCHFREGKLWINGVCFGALILPYREYLDAQTAEFVIRAGKEGLPIYLMRQLPKQMLSHEMVPAAFADAVQIVADADALCARLQRDAFDISGMHRALRSFCMKAGETLTTMWFNESIDETVRVRVMPKDPAYRLWEQYDPWSDRMESFAVPKGGVSLKLLPGQALFLRFRKESADGLPVAKQCINRKNLHIPWTLSAKAMGDSLERQLQILAPGDYPPLNTPAYDPSFVGTYRYEGEVEIEKAGEQRAYVLHLPEASDAVKVTLNQRELGWICGFPGCIDLTKHLQSGKNTLLLEAVTTLVWERKDGASTHLQVPATGITKEPYIETMVPVYDN